MRTKEEIELKIQEVGAKLDTCSYSKRDTIDAILDVLENDMDYDEIENTYFDENETDRESSANRAREWMDGDLSDEDFYF